MKTCLEKLTGRGFQRVAGDGLVGATGMLAAAAIFCVPSLGIQSLYRVRLEADRVVATPVLKAQAQALRVVESTECNHRVESDSRIIFQGACEYLSALYHYVPESGEEGPRQVTGGFSISRKNANSYILAVAKPIEFYQKSSPQVKTSPIPESLKK